MTKISKRLFEITNLPQATFSEILYRYFLFYLKSPFLEWQLLFKATFIPTHIAIKYKLKLFFFFYFRCGGQGDILSGALAVFLFWASRNPDCPEPGPAQDKLLSAMYFMLWDSIFSTQAFLLCRWDKNSK